MKDLNRIVVVGRITKDVDDKSFGYTTNGTARMNVSIAVNDSRKGADGNYSEVASFFDVSLWGKMAESLRPYISKGVQVAIEGRLVQDRWQDQNGQNRSKVYINAENLQLLSRPSANAQQGGGNPVNNQNYNGGNYQNPQPQNNGGFQEDYPADWDNIPFN